MLTCLRSLEKDLGWGIPWSSHIPVGSRCFSPGRSLSLFIKTRSLEDTHGINVINPIQGSIFHARSHSWVTFSLKKCFIHATQPVGQALVRTGE